jgi:sulfur carrier protein ThiS
LRLPRLACCGTHPRGLKLKMLPSAKRWRRCERRCWGAEKGQLEKLTTEQLSYGHSDGRVQDKAQFIDGVVTRKALVKSLTFPQLTVAVAGNAAVVRHVYESESETDGKTTTVKIGALQVWQKRDGNWKLLARQGYKLA